MILSEYSRRWAEVRFYQFVTETYHLRNKSIDIVNYADMICDIGDISKQKIRNLISVMTNDTYYRSTKREIILLGYKLGMTTVELADYLDMTRQGVSKYIRTHGDTYSPLPRCGIDEDCEIVKFLQTLEQVNSIGHLGNGTIN